MRISDWSSDVCSSDLEWCPIAFTERRQRTWLPVRYEDLSAIAHDVARFSSRDIAVVSPLDVPLKDVIPVPPISSEPPCHTWARRLLLPAFGTSAIDKLTPTTPELAHSLSDAHSTDGGGGGGADYRGHLPAGVDAPNKGVPH